MSDTGVRRSIFRQGFVILLLGLLSGFGVVAGGPKARSWMATHVTLMVTALIIIAVASVWDQLRLSARQRAVLRFAVVLEGYWGGLAGVFATVFSVPGPVSGHGVAPSGWAATVFFTAFIPVITVLPFVFTSLVLYGLRGASPEP